MSINENREKHTRQVNMLMDMLKEAMDKYQRYGEYYEEWIEAEPPWAGSSYYSLRPVRPSSTEIKRLTLMLRKETLELDKYL